MGHPDAAYELDPDAQARLLGWLYARADRARPAGKPGRRPMTIDDMFPVGGG